MSSTTELFSSSDQTHQHPGEGRGYSSLGARSTWSVLAGKRNLFIGLSVACVAAAIVAVAVAAPLAGTGNKGPETALQRARRVLSESVLIDG
jgi:hypothetical protein